MENEELDVTELKYVLYARKSSEDEERQTKSIPHQIDECKLLAKRLGKNCKEFNHRGIKISKNTQKKRRL